MIPSFLREPDNDWSAFSTPELEALIRLRLVYRGPTNGEIILMDVVPLTLSRVETWAAIYWAKGGASERFSLSPTE